MTTHYLPAELAARLNTIRVGAPTEPDRSTILAQISEVYASLSTFGADWQAWEEQRRRAAGEWADGDRVDYDPPEVHAALVALSTRDAQLCAAESGPTEVIRADRSAPGWDAESV